MEIFQTMWTALTTPNEGVTNLIVSLLTFIEMTVCMLLFTTLLNINCTKRRKIVYVLLVAGYPFFARFFIPTNYLTVLNMIIFPLTIMFILKTSFFKSITAVIISFIIMAVLDPIFINIIIYTFNITYIDIVSIPIYRILYLIGIYTSFFLLYLVAKKYDINIKLLDDMNKKTKNILIINSIFGILAIFIQRYLSNNYTHNIPIPIITLSTISLLIYFCVSMYSLIRSTKLEIAEQNLEEAQLYNKSLKILHDNVRAFKHDFSNIVQAIGRLC